MKREVHSAHLGISGCLRRARESLFWPGMTSELKEFISTCETCSKFKVNNPPETLMSHDLPERPYEKVGTDLFTIQDHNYLITVDYFSNFWEIDRLEDTLSPTIIRKLKAHFARFGIPSVLMSDNAPNLTSDRFMKFTQQWDIHHVTSSPHHAKSNGMAESAVKTAKRIIKKCQDSGEDQFLAILSYRNTLSQGLDECPAQRMLNRRTRTLLPTTSKLLTPKSTNFGEDKHKRIYEFLFLKERGML